MRVRIALGLALLATLIGFLIDMSGSAPRLAGGDRIHFPAPDPAVALAPGGSKMCVEGTILPGDAASMVIAIHGAVRLPRITATFTVGTGAVLAHGVLPAGAVESGAVTIPLQRPAHAASALGILCLRGGGHATLIYDGVTGVGTTTVNGVDQTGSPAIIYYRRGSETWWELLGALDLRFGLGKAALFGDWTLPVIALAALALFAGAVRLLLRELR
jgi:hypothetical protein